MVMRRLGAVMLVSALLLASCSSTGNDFGQDRDMPKIGEVDDSGPSAQDPASPDGSSVEELLAPIGLSQARAAWEAAGILSYRISATESRNYWSNGCTWETVVDGGAIVKTLTDPPSGPKVCGDRVMTVEELHSHIEHLAGLARSDGDGAGNVLDVTFNSVGVPESIEFDILRMVDEESLLKVTFTVLP